MKRWGRWGSELASEIVGVAFVDGFGFGPKGNLENRRSQQTPTVFGDDGV